MKDSKTLTAAAGRERFSLPRFLVCMLGVIALDQATKLLILFNVHWEKGDPTYFFGSEHPPIAVIDGFFYIVHITNEGAAWGMFSGQTFFLTSVALIVLLAMWLFRKHLGVENKWVQVAMGLFAGGIVGNLIDRVCYGHVIDFLDVHLPIVNYRWPAFNIADSAISIGVTLYIIMSFILDHRTKQKAQAQTKSDA